MKKIYRRIALLLCISMIAGIVGRSELKAASSLNVRLIIVDKFVTKKEYNLKLGKKRQLNVRVNNAFGKTKVTYSSADKTIAKVTKKGFIRAMALGSVKIRVKVKCTSGSKKKVKKTWVRINVIGNDDVYPTSDPVPEYTPSYTDTVTPTTAPATGVMSAMLLVNGTTSKQFPMIILDNESGRMLYNSLPKVIYFTDQNQNTKTATETELIYAMDEFKPTNLAAGDLMLYGNSRYELTYEDHTSGYAYTRLARVTNVTGLKDALGTGPVSVTIIKSTLPTTGPSGTVAPTYAPGTSVRPTVTMPPILPVSPTPTPSLPPGVSAVPAATVTPGTTPRPSAS
ncbi:MAG: Ig-like domain-containing protein, partial [Eubacterium sp.]|nr:Ig-like domain-containing protein [Eubacterium sp.]